MTGKYLYIQQSESVWDADVWIYRFNNVTGYFWINDQQDATFLDLVISTDALQVSGGSSAHHQDHVTVHINTY